MSEIRNLLEAIGLGQYGDAFEANKIDMDLLGYVEIGTCEEKEETMVGKCWPFASSFSSHGQI